MSETCPWCGDDESMDDEVAPDLPRLCGSCDQPSFRGSDGSLFQWAGELDVPIARRIGRSIGIVLARGVVIFVVGAVVGLAVVGAVYLLGG